MKLLILCALFLQMDISATFAFETKMDNQLKFAWFEEKNKIELVFNSPVSDIEQNKIKVFNHRGTPIKIKSILKNEHKITINTDILDFKQNYYAIWNDKKIYAYPSRHLLNKYFYYKGKLGSYFDKNGLVRVAVWSPTATNMTFLLFDKKNKDSLILKQTMLKKSKGIWEVKLDHKQLGIDSLDGYFYQFIVHAFGKDHRAYDPYSKSAAAFNPKTDQTMKSSIIDPSKTKLKGFEKSYKSNRELLPLGEMSFIGYEAHIRDLTMDKSLVMPDELRGTYGGVKYALKNIIDLGITHIQFLPFQNFSTVDEYDRSYVPYSIHKDHVNYNWGYDPQHYFSPEGWYSTKAYDPYARILELKEMIKNLHDNGIGIIQDVVYNHLYDGLSFEAIAPGCYLRRKMDGAISDKSGAGYTLDSKIFMARRMIIDSLEYFHREFHVNGLRFDLMGFIDTETMTLIRKRLGSDVILYGEAWEFTDLPAIEAPTKTNLPKEAKLSAFNDVTRESYLSGDEGKGFLLGNTQLLPKVHSGIVGSINSFPSKNIVMTTDSYHNFADSPKNTINYLSIHDGGTLWDKLNRDYKGTIKTRINRIKQGLAMLFTSQGKIVLHGGIEIARSKPVTSNDPSSNRAFKGQNDNKFYHSNSYRSSDDTNQIDWSRLDKFKDLRNYLKGLIALRKSENAFRLSRSEEIINKLSFIAEHTPPNLSFDTGYKNFNELNELTIKFIGGPKDTSMYLAGEVFGDAEKNPEENPFVIDFDEFGEAQITFNKDQIATFDLSSWSNPNALQFKLVSTAGKWDTITTAYTEMGHNTIPIESIEPNDKNSQSALINLKIINHTSGTVDFSYNQFVAYTIKASKNSKYDHFIIIHNAENGERLIRHKISSKNASILVDNENAGITPLANSKVLIKWGQIIVPPHTSVVIGVNK